VPVLDQEAIQARKVPVLDQEAIQARKVPVLDQEGGRSEATGVMHNVSDDCVVHDPPARAKLEPPPYFAGWYKNHNSSFTF
jgi:hypothetical protein